MSTNTAAKKEKLHTSLTGWRWVAEVGWRHLVGIAVIIYCVIPLLYVLSVSLVPNATLTGSNELFRTISADNYTALGERNGGQYWHWILNSLVVSSLTAIGTVLMGAAAAYAFSRYRFKGRRGTLTFLLLVQMFPQMLAFVALYLLLLGIQDVFPIIGLNSKLGLVAVGDAEAIRRLRIEPCALGRHVLRERRDRFGIGGIGAHLHALGTRDKARHAVVRRRLGVGISGNAIQARLRERVACERDPA